MNSYLLEGIDFVLIDNEINKIIKDNKFIDAERSVYDLEEVELSHALEDLDTYNFLSDKKIIIVKNIDFIKYDDCKKDFDHLLKYIDNPQDDKLLIILAKKLNNTTKICKELKKKCKYISIEINSKAFIKNELEGYSVKQDVINELDFYCQGDITKIKNECLKLKNYKLDEKTITIDDVHELVTRKLVDSQDLIFSLTRSICEKDKKKSLKEYKELLEYNFDVLSIIGLLGSQFRNIYQVMLLNDRNLNNKEIADMLGEKEFRIKKTKELISYYSESEILNIMKMLSDIDLRIKTTDTDSYNEFELFILNL